MPPIKKTGFAKDKTSQLAFSSLEKSENTLKESSFLQVPKVARKTTLEILKEAKLKEEQQNTANY